MAHVLLPPLMIITFAIALFFVPWRSAALLAVFVPFAGGIGFMVAALVQSPLYPRDPLRPDYFADERWVPLYFGISLVAGIAAATFAGRAALKLGRRFSKTQP